MAGPSRFEVDAPLGSRVQYMRPRLHVGSGATFLFHVKERDEITAVDLTGYTVDVAGKLDLQDSATLFEKTGLTGIDSDASKNGEIQLDLAADDLPSQGERFVMVLTVKDGSGDVVGQVWFVVSVVEGF